MKCNTGLKGLIGTQKLWFLQTRFYLFDHDSYKYLCINQPICSQCTLSLPPENIRKPWGALKTNTLTVYQFPLSGQQTKTIIKNRKNKKYSIGNTLSICSKSKNTRLRHEICSSKQ